MTAQLDRDKAIDGLFDSLFSFFDIVEDLSHETVDALKERSDILSRITHQTLECHYFIIEFYKTEGFRTSISSFVVHRADRWSSAACP